MLSTSPADTSSVTQSLSAGTYRYSVRALGPGGLSPWAVVTCATCGPDGAFTLSGGTTGGGKGGGKK